MRIKAEAVWFAVFLLVSAAVCGIEASRPLRSGDGRCEEIYVVREGETLQTISVKCNCLSILDDNPQILDSDDLGPGTVLFLRRPEKEGRARL
ncbi:hypothetical protein HPP92_003184 [Vanilla planifolia]|uniref:LysM domain-containing protein n=1 Tax=Vanilla planifolia TaxID=51239 RepID=A0A835S8M6_VANPL|nr:hypothetical protein HPP92_003578 [Vanilla planifolia]KAG0503112.1 hypothetical protein HPP92_003184 [Vanilla planifolia]